MSKNASLNPFNSLIEEPLNGKDLRRIAHAIERKIYEELREEDDGQPSQYSLEDRIYFALFDLYTDAHDKEPHI